MQVSESVVVKVPRRVAVLLRNDPVMTIRRLLCLPLIALVLVPGTSVGAQTGDARDQQRRLREQRAQLATQLNTLKASERQLLRAAAMLDDQVLAQAARVDAARQAVAASEREAREAAAAAEQTRQRQGSIRRAFVRRAVESFMTTESPLDGVVRGGDIARTARAEVLISAVANTDEDLIDQLRAAEEDFEVQRAAAEAAAERARARRVEAERRLQRLEADQQAQRRVRDAITARQREVLREIDAHARAEGELNRIIAERTAEARRRAGTPPPDMRQGGGGCIWPTQGRVTSEYGRRSGRQHQGMDIAAPTGTRIVAAKAGVVVFAGQQSGYGNVIVLDHGNMTTLYAHQSRLAARDGQSVSQGQQIGYVGNTGRSTGPHLHFETRYGGAARNPRSCLP